MSPSQLSETILLDPAFAGRTLVVRWGVGWAAFDIPAEGGLGEGRPVEEDPTLTAWRGGPLR